ncbi:Uncharacterised protein [Legionella pneumophila]|uniref:hypothetical protein n=1 Tax=Legionella pneumophila TaxID=446 RepID=UPI000E042A4E|nr:hypothetical protein [Legionella pneumophila]STY21413.1 Uncharacterised protein [Legionella pneumophila]
MSTRDKSCVGEGVMADGERLGVKYFRLYRWINEDSKGEVEMIVFTSNTRGSKISVISCRSGSMNRLTV